MEFNGAGGRGSLLVAGNTLHPIPDEIEIVVKAQ